MAAAGRDGRAHVGRGVEVAAGRGLLHDLTPGHGRGAGMEPTQHALASLAPTAADVDADITVRTFAESYEKLSALLRDSWEEEYGDRFLVDYDPQFVRWVLSEPGNDPELLLGAY